MVPVPTWPAPILNLLKMPQHCLSVPGVWGENEKRRMDCTSVWSWKMPLTRALFSFVSLDVSRCSDSRDENTESQFGQQVSSTETTGDTGSFTTGSISPLQINHNMWPEVCGYYPRTYPSAAAPSVPATHAPTSVAPPPPHVSSAPPPEPFSSLPHASALQWFPLSCHFLLEASRSLPPGPLRRTKSSIKSIENYTPPPLLLLPLFLAGAFSSASSVSHCRFLFSSSFSGFLWQRQVWWMCRSSNLSDSTRVLWNTQGAQIWAWSQDEVQARIPNWSWE